MGLIIPYQTFIPVPLSNKDIFKDWRSLFALIHSADPGLQHCFPSITTRGFRTGQEVFARSVVCSFWSSLGTRVGKGHGTEVNHTRGEKCSWREAQTSTLPVRLLQRGRGGSANKTFLFVCKAWPVGDLGRVTLQRAPKKIMRKLGWRKKVTSKALKASLLQPHLLSPASLLFSSQYRGLFQCAFSPFESTEPLSLFPAPHPPPAVPAAALYFTPHRQKCRAGALLAFFSAKGINNLNEHSRSAVPAAACAGTS